MAHPPGDRVVIVLVVTVIGLTLIGLGYMWGQADGWHGGYTIGRADALDERIETIIRDLQLDQIANQRQIRLAPPPAVLYDREQRGWA